MSDEKTNPILDQLNKSLGETLDFIKGTSGTAIDFAKEQTPLYIQELLHYDFVYSMIWFIFGLVLIAASSIGAYNLYKLSKNGWAVPFLYQAYGRNKIIHNPSKEDWDRAKNDKSGNFPLEVPDDKILTNVLFFMIHCFVGLAFCFSNLTWVKIKIAPRVYVVEQINQMLK